MPLFTLPIAHTSRHPASHAPLKSILSQKRKRGASPDDAGSVQDFAPSPDHEQSALSAALTNPLSLTPDEIVQYQTAGLALNEYLPSVKDFPHRGLARRRRREDTEGETEDGMSGTERLAVSKHERLFGLRTKHLGTLTAVLHRCLDEGDIWRASKAWAMLLRSQIDGKGVELRRSGYWGIGAELLIREGEKMVKMTLRGEDSDEEQTEGNDTDDDIEVVDGERRWGTKEGLSKAKDYYERLILEYPYKRQFANSVNALDFWPAMLSCEIYGIQFSQRAQLQKISAREESQDYDGTESVSDNMEDDEDEYTFSQRVEEKRRQRKDERSWKERENVRLQTLAATQAVTTRMDELMTSPPYSDSVRLLRLRAMLMLYVGDLSVPDILAGDMDADVEDNDLREDLATRRIERRQRKANRDVGFKILRRQKKRARKIFRKIGELSAKEAEEMSGGEEERSD